MVLSRNPLCANIYVDFFPTHAHSVSILTHFHSDHMTNLRKHHQNQIYCSYITARLLQYRYQCEDVRAIPLDTIFCIGDDVKVVFVDANHCPGSVICIATHNGGVFINTGDIRWYPDLARRVLGHVGEGARIERLHLDFSWAHEAFTSFPTKHESIQDVMEVLRDAPSEESIWLHSHGLGDEELISAIISRFPSENFYFVDKKRYGELEVLGGVLTSRCILCNRGDRAELLTLRAKHRFFVVKNGRQRKGLRGVEISCSTLWWARQRHSDLRNASVVQDPRTRVWHVLWAMHSSLEELQDFVKDLRPKVLHPICGVILHEDSLTNPLDRFAHLLASLSSTDSPLPISDGTLAQIVPKDRTETLHLSLPKRASLDTIFASCATQNQPSTTHANVLAYGAAGENDESDSVNTPTRPHGVGTTVTSNQLIADTAPYPRPHGAAHKPGDEQLVRKRCSIMSDDATSCDGQLTDQEEESVMNDSEPVPDAKRRRCLTTSGAASVSAVALPVVSVVDSNQNNLGAAAPPPIGEPQRVADAPEEGIVVPLSRASGSAKDEFGALSATLWTMSQCGRKIMPDGAHSPAREHHETTPRSASQSSHNTQAAVWTHLNRDPIDLRNAESDTSCPADTNVHERTRAANQLTAFAPALLVPDLKRSMSDGLTLARVEERGDDREALSSGAEATSTGSEVRGRAKDGGIAISRINHDAIDLCDTDSNTIGASGMTPLARERTVLLPTSIGATSAPMRVRSKEECPDGQANHLRACTRKRDGGVHDSRLSAMEGNAWTHPCIAEDRCLPHPYIVEDRSSAHPSSVEERGVAHSSTVKERILAHPSNVEERGSAHPSNVENRDSAPPSIVVEDRSSAHSSTVEERDLAHPSSVKDRILAHPSNVEERGSAHPSNVENRDSAPPSCVEGCDWTLPSCVERNWCSRRVTDHSILSVPPVRKAFSRALDDIEHATDTSSTSNSPPTDCPQLDSLFRADRGCRKRRKQRPLCRNVRASLFPNLFASQSSDSNSRSLTPLRGDPQPPVTPCLGDSCESRPTSHTTHASSVTSNPVHDVIDVSSQNSEPRPPPITDISHFAPLCASSLVDAHAHAHAHDTHQLPRLRFFSSTDPASPKGSLRAPPPPSEQRRPSHADINESSVTIDLSTQPPDIGLDACSPLIPVSDLSAIYTRTLRFPLSDFRISPHESPLPHLPHVAILSPSPTAISQSMPYLQGSCGIVSRTTEDIRDVASYKFVYSRNPASSTHAYTWNSGIIDTHAPSVQQAHSANDENAVVDLRPPRKKTRIEELGCVRRRDDLPRVIEIQSDSQEML
eukprot:GEMP01001995.1.p1 GENE.GEMP01001995.1~~GEMP01001995.1.p1  ORF type:complete len:1312 (-),score=239.18 GEMP01001995.1:836-4771(-)